jgi:hypothetical protein
MSSVNCPIECIWREEPETWLEKHEGFLLGLTGLLGGGLGALLAYFIRSRCTKIGLDCKCCGIVCDRSPLTVDEIEVIDARTTNP